MPMPVPKRPADTLAGIQDAMHRFVESRGWYDPDSSKPQEPRNLAASISLEANELLECFQWSGEGSPDCVAAELADVILYAAQLANVMGIELSDAIAKKLEVNDQRFPAAA
ncbi:MAG TPA: nucleotide pyrophosphohydrolase [Solirubrobacterales bacterium]|jgi:NTP pyrophosphatase (non-canonical NTP hydrolase)